MDELDQILDRDETWDAEAEEEGDGEPVPIPLVSRRYLVSGAVPGTTRVNIERATGNYLDAGSEGGLPFSATLGVEHRSAERRVGTEGGRTCRSGWAPIH